MTIFLLSFSIVLATQLILAGWQTRSSARVGIIESHLGVRSKPLDRELLIFFARFHRLLAGETLNPWGTDARVSQTLRHCQDQRTLIQFRRSQMLCMFSLQAVIMIWASLGTAIHRSVSPGFVLLLLVAVIPASGWAMYNWYQNRAVKIQQAIDQQLGGILELLAFSVSAGEPIVLAIERVSNLCSGYLANVLADIPDRLADGATVAQALAATTNQTSSSALSRGIRSVQTALDRGTPIAGVLRAQAAQARATNQQYSLELAGKKEAMMMVPVVFFILPMIVFIALYPGLSALQLT